MQWHKPHFWTAYGGCQSRSNTVLPLARTYQFSAYDAAYLELAIREGLPLATLDDELRQAACAAGVALVQA